PRTHLVFLKTHKTGGSSVVNLLHRFGESRGLRFALPHGYQFGYPEPFRAQRVKGFHPGGTPFDIICHHIPPQNPLNTLLTAPDPPQVAKVMPNDSFYFSIVRDPGTLGESAFSYYRSVAPAFRRAPSLAAFVAAPLRFYEAGARGNHYARNLQWFDFGLPPVPPSDAGAVQAALSQLDRDFPLVLLTERFDESLVLLRDALCWPDDAVAAFVHNSRTPAGKARRVSQGDIERLRAWNHLDWALYSHLNRSFAKKVEAYGAQRLRKEVEGLRKRREELARRCLKGGGPLPARVIADGELRPFQPPGREQILGYEVKEGLEPAERLLCSRLATPELQYKDLLDRKQF
ncbi:G3ST4 sulfotransferase, partial [Rhinopomastus cyanomelas]|nr:G3ST4 sulfotransferase [Rhinopomastus cyanomelas]